MFQLVLLLKHQIAVKKQNRKTENSGNPKILEIKKILEIQSCTVFRKTAPFSQKQHLRNLLNKQIQTTFLTMMIILSFPSHQKNDFALMVISEILKTNHPHKNAKLSTYKPQNKICELFRKFAHSQLCHQTCNPSHTQCIFLLLNNMLQWSYQILFVGYPLTISKKPNKNFL